jgi:holin-like protein
MYLSSLSPFLLPASVISMLILFALLLSRAVKPASLQETTDALLGNMAFFFLPSGVGLIAHFEILRDGLFPFLIIGFTTSFLTFAASAFTVAAVVRLRRRERRGRVE